MSDEAMPGALGSNAGFGPADNAHLPFAGWLLDADTKHERAVAGSAWAPSMGGITAEPLVLRSEALAAIEKAVAAERERRHALAEPFREYLYRVTSQVRFEHAEWAREQGEAILRALKA